MWDDTPEVVQLNQEHSQIQSVTSLTVKKEHRSVKKRTIWTKAVCFWSVSALPDSKPVHTQCFLYAVGN